MEFMLVIPGPSNLSKVSLNNIPLVFTNRGEGEKGIYLNGLLYFLVQHFYLSFYVCFSSLCSIPDPPLSFGNLVHVLKLEHLQSDGFIRQLLFPESYMIICSYAEVLRMNEVPELAVIQDGEISEPS